MIPWTYKEIYTFVKIGKLEVLNFYVFAMDLNETYDIGHDNSSGVVYILFKWKNQKIVTLVKRSIVIAY